MSKNKNLDGGSLTKNKRDSLSTDKTDKRMDVSNRDFMTAVFGKPLETNNRPVKVSFAGNPHAVSKKEWRGQSWFGQSAPADHNNYFSLATFTPDKNGNYRRQKKHFWGLHAIMLDDTGTKVPKDRITLEPSWEVETSPGNFQTGFILKEPETDQIKVDRFMEAIMKAGLCDPGAGGPTARLARLPQAINGKSDPPFQCRLTVWQPDVRYSIDELVHYLQLDMRPVDRRKTREGNDTRSEKVVNDDNPVLIPKAKDNPVIKTLKERGLYKSSLGDRKHDITCPWCHEHTDGVDDGSAYFEPDDIYLVGGFKCHHGHCQDRRIKDLLEFLEVDVSAARMKSTIILVPGHLHRVIDAAELELTNTGKYYQRGGLISQIINNPENGETEVRELKASSIAVALSAAATWERYDKREQTYVQVDPPQRHSTALLDTPEYKYLPVLNGLSRQPYLRDDGTIHSEPGYDPESGMFAVFDPEDFCIPENPSKSDAQKALQVLDEALKEFAFAAPEDKAAALAAILTAAIRTSLPFAPMFHARAAQISSGKSYLCSIISAFATPKPISPTEFAKDDEEFKKALLAELLRAPAVVFYDNLTTDITPHKSLCAALTSELVSGRILGFSKTATVSTRSLFLSSGNNVGPIKDMTRRCLVINLDPGCENPEARDFKNPDLLDEILQNRGKYVSAALTIIKAWICSGKPKTKCKPLGSYGKWMDFCCQPLMWLGCPNPTNSIYETINDDPERDHLGRLLALWHESYGKEGLRVRDLIVHANRSVELSELLEDIAYDPREKINRRVLGRWLKRNANKRVDGLRLVKASGRRSVEMWRVEKV